jgi:DNA polymerase-3 subunit alpha (Gram-positive type)
MKNNEVINKMVSDTKNGGHFVVIDLETTGFSPTKFGQIIEIGAVHIDDGVISRTFHTLVSLDKTGKAKIPKQIQALTHITDDMLRGQQTLGDALYNLYTFMELPLRGVVAHNADFDWGRFLTYFFPRIGVPIYPEQVVIDTAKLSKFLYPNEQKHGLDDICKRENLTLTDHHRALEDAMATAEVFVRYLEKPEINQFQDSFHHCSEDNKESAISPIIINQVQYWEKNINGELKQRVYINTEEGSIYYDINRGVFENKDIVDPVPFVSIIPSVLKLIGVYSIQELAQFRGKKFA